MFIVAKLFVTAVLALVQVLIGKLRFLDENPAAWKSAGAGVGISYAFLVAGKILDRHNL